MSAEWEDPDPWVTEDGKRQSSSVVPFRFGAKTYADYQPRTWEQWESEKAVLEQLATVAAVRGLES